MAKWCIGIDLGGTFIKSGLLGADRQPGRLFQVPTPREGGTSVADQMVAAARQAMQSAGLSSGDVVGVGIGSPGPLDLANGIVMALPNIPNMDNVPLVKLVSQGLGMKAVVLENDANAAAYGEYICGSGGGGGDMVLLTLGTGLGSGIIIDGKVLHGAHDIGGELGHLIVDPGGEQCGCGQQGCLERYCSATHVANRAARAIRDGEAETSLKTVLERKGAIDARDINDARRAGDELAGKFWDEAAYYIALGCVNICRIFDPDQIVLGGGMTKAGEDLIRPVLWHFRRLHWTATEPKTRIAIAVLGNDAGVIGAAGVAWQAFGSQYTRVANASIMI